MMRRIFVLPTAAALLLGGCLSSILPEPAPPPAVYRLDVPTETAQKRNGATVVRVDNPSGARTFNTRDVLVITSSGTLSSASGAQWADTIPQLVQDAALAAMARSPDYISVIPVAGTRADIRVHIDIRDFAAVYDQGDLSPPMARTRLSATMAEASTRKFLGSFDVTGEARAQDNRVSAIVDAQSAATRDAMDQIVAWMESVPSPS